MAKPITQLSGDLREMTSKIIEKVRQILPAIVSIEGLRHFEQSWDNQGFTDKSLKKWKNRKAPKHSTRKDGTENAASKRWNQKNIGRAILISNQSDTKGTHLKDSLREEHTEREVIFSTDKVYAQVHNEGGHSGRGKGFTMVKREFMGPSQALDKKIQDKLTKEITKYLDTLK